MAVAISASSLQVFLEQVRSCTSFVLLADYDGTLAPLQMNRDLATPYGGIPPLLLELAAGGARVGIVSGRPAQEVQKLLGIDGIEIWGSHGAERLLPTGEHIRMATPDAAHLRRLAETLTREGLATVMEVKPFGIAVHWRGLSSSEAGTIRSVAVQSYQALRVPDLELFAFDGGVEFRSCTNTKARAVLDVKREERSRPIMYLGDDLTDEDAFRALDATDVSILVRKEYRPTAARFWIQSPEQVIALLQWMADVVGGEK